MQLYLGITPLICILCLSVTSSTRTLIEHLTSILDDNGWLPNKVKMVTKYQNINKEVPELFAMGILMALAECQHQVKWSRWNCPKSSFENITHTKNVTATREDAFVHAIASAGAMYTLIKQGCYAGSYTLCGCTIWYGEILGRQNRGISKKEGWDWSGCNENVRYANRVVKHIFDAFEDRDHKRGAIHRHNNAVGRKVFRDEMPVTCYCHGPTGSCSLRTCWKKPREFRQVGNRLKELYYSALEVEGNPTTSGTRIEFKTKRDLGISLSGELLYSDESPDYCPRATGLKSNETIHRECSKAEDETTTVIEKYSCLRICTSCGFKVEEKIVKVNEKCNCKLQWCCSIQCEVCTKSVKRYYCKI